MTGSQQSDGSSSSLDTKVKSVGGVSSSKAPATANPAGGTPNQNDASRASSDARSMQLDDDESADIEERSNAAAP
jgi:hypothetical protein